LESAIRLVGTKEDTRKKALSKVLILLILLAVSIMSQNVIPVHIAFIPILIPPLLKILNELNIDRRLTATIITFGLTAPYILLPVGFGGIFHDILRTNMGESGLDISLSSIPTAMMIPVSGMVVGLLIAVFFSYRKPRTYEQKAIADQETATYTFKSITFALLAVVVSLVTQVYLTEVVGVQGMIYGSLVGIIILYIGGAMKFNETDVILTSGMRMMAFIGFVMITASGFASVLKETGHVERLVEDSANLIGGNQGIGALLMLLVGLLVTMGIGSSFSTIPIITTIFVPLCLEFGFGPMATIAIVGTAAALGDAGSPASDSTLGPTSGLAADGNHNHIWDTCVPTFLHFNIPLIIFGWMAAMIL
jgi:putative amino acid transporter